MIRTAAETEIRNVAAPLWYLLNYGASWPGVAGEFDLVKSGASAIVAHLAYCAIGADEKEQHNRAKVVPCRVYQKLLAAPDVDLVAILAGRDFANVGVVRTKFFVAIIIPAKEKLLIGVRGTQFAYDWLINVNFAKARDAATGEYFHAGFLREAQELASALRRYLLERFPAMLQSGAVYVAGHSLGGAVAALLNRWETIVACYLFGAPRISNSKHLGRVYEPFATRRDLDIVPHCPPASFRYANFERERTTSGEPFAAASNLEFYSFASWLFQLSVNKFPENHSMERYRLEVLQAVKQHPDFARWLKDCPDIEP